MSENNSLKNFSYFNGGRISTSILPTALHSFLLSERSSGKKQTKINRLAIFISDICRRIFFPKLGIITLYKTSINLNGSLIHF